MMVNGTRCLNRFACIELDKTIVTNAALATVILFLATGHYFASHRSYCFLNMTIPLFNIQ